MTHPCIKCGTKYDSEDVDAYLCEKCLNLRASIAADLDRKYNTTEAANPHMSPLQAFEAEGKTIEREGRRISFAPSKL